MKQQLLTHQSGFTLVETLVAILILSMTIGAVLALAAGGYFGVRYARNDIVATNLLQESLEYVRNTRDTAQQQQSVTTFDEWLSTFDFCRTDTGCMINPYHQDGELAVIPCATTCDNISYYSDTGFYGYTDSISKFARGTPLQTTFVRTVTMQRIGTTNQIIVTARMKWLNGTSSKSTQQSIILSPWSTQ